MKIPSPIKQLTIPLSVIVTLNLVLKLVMFFLLYHGQDMGAGKKIIDDSDELSYDFIAHDLVQYKTFAPPSDSIYIAKAGPINKPHLLCVYHDALRLPGYPVFIATVYFIAGIKPYIAVLVQILVSLLSVVFVYRIAILLSSNKTIATIAGLLYAIDIHSIYVASLLLTDTLFTLALLASVYYMIKAILTRGYLSAIASAALMAVTCIIRPVGLLYPFILLPLYYIFNKDNTAHKIKLCGAYLLISYVFLIAWSFRNHKVYGHWQLTTQSGYNLVMWNAAFTESIISHRGIDEVRIDLQRQADSLNFSNTPNVFDKADIFDKVGYAYFKKHKMAMIVSQIKGGVHMFMSIGNIDIANALGWHANGDRGFPEINMQRIGKNFAGSKETMLAVIILLIMLIQYVGAFFGIIDMYRNRQYMFLILSILTILYFTLVTGIAGMYRYKLPLTPFIVVLAGYGYYRLFNLRSKA